MTKLNRYNNSDPFGPTDDIKFYYWFAGFCDAEGNFQTTNFKRVNKKGIITSIGLKYSFHIGLQLKDKSLLEFIQTKLNNMGKIYEYNNINYII